MILQVNPESSLLVRSAAAVVLALHIGAGCVGLLSGAAALLARKGQRLHRMVGNVFFVSMLITSAIGAVVSPFLPRPQWGNVAMGAFTFYLVATSWVTIRRKEGSVGFFEIGAFLVALGVAATCLTLGFLAVRVPTGKIGGLSYSGAFVLAAIWALAAAGDLKMILRRGVFGAQLIARHLWRMCVALLIAALSLFLGQPQLFPASVHKTGVLFVPEIAVVVLMIFWLIRVRFTNRFRHDAADHGAP